jgi:OmpA-OmpF porin, OOP family
MRSIFATVTIMSMFATATFAATDANTTSGLLTSEAISAPSKGFMPFVGLGAGYTGYETKFDVEGIPSSAKLLGSYYMTNTPVVMDLGVGVANQQFSQTFASERAVTSASAEAAARYQFANRVQVGVVANTIFNKGDLFGANQADAQFAGLQALKEFNVAQSWVARIGGRLMTDLNVNNSTVNMAMVDMQLGYNPYASRQSAKSIAKVAAPAAAPVAAFVPASALKNISSKEILAKNALLFKTNSDAIAATDLAQLNKLAAVVKQAGVQSIDVVGHADTTGDAARNAALSLKRAQQVKTALVAAGLSDVAINIFAKGSSESLASKTESRRVELILNGVQDAAVLKKSVQ